MCICWTLAGSRDLRQTSGCWTRTRPRCCAAGCCRGYWRNFTATCHRGPCSWRTPSALVGTTAAWRSWCWTSTASCRAMPTRTVGWRSSGRAGPACRRMRERPPMAASCWRIWGGRPGTGRPCWRRACR